MVNGTLSPEEFRLLQQRYEERTGYHLVLADAHGVIQMGAADCDRFPCMKTCRECREQIIREALRTDSVCVDTCHDGFVLWGLPLSRKGQAIGGLVVIGGKKAHEPQNGEFVAACTALRELVRESGFLPERIGSFPETGPASHRHLQRVTFEQLSRGLESASREFLSSLQTAEFDAAARHFQSVRDAFHSGNSLPMDVLRGYAGRLVFQAQSLLAEAGMDPYSCLSEAGFLLEHLAAATNFPELLKVLDVAFARFLELAHQRPKDADDLLIERATTYLEEHVHEELSRETVARAVGVSPSHFSRLIREKKGRTFTDLLNQYRVEHAGKLLVRSSKTLAQIASEAGFCDQSYFSKVFRRYKGLSPAKYRESHQF